MKAGWNSAPQSSESIRLRLLGVIGSPKCVAQDFRTVIVTCQLQRVDEAAILGIAFVRRELAYRAASREFVNLTI
jgi:hypothetical protein